MIVRFAPQDIHILLESIQYSKQRIRDAQGTPYDLRQEKLRQLDSAEGKLKNAEEEPARPA
jgi:hypothetical protein